MAAAAVAAADEEVAPWHSHLLASAWGVRPAEAVAAPPLPQRCQRTVQTLPKLLCSSPSAQSGLPWRPGGGAGGYACRDATASCSMLRNNVPALLRIVARFQGRERTWARQ